MKKEVIELQKRMYEEGMDVYYIPSSDFHASEYVHPYFRCREFISGFDGSAGEMIITSDAAYLWTDGRYFLQAEKQLAGSGIKLMKMREEGVPTVLEFLSSLADEYLKSGRESNFFIGFDGRVVSSSFGFEIEEALLLAEGRHQNNAEDGSSDDGYGRLRIKWDEDLAGMIWEDRPEFETHKIWELPLSSAGVSASDKIKAARAVMYEEGAEYLLFSELAAIAWLLNLRGSDIAYTPVFYSYLLICPDSVNVYLTDTAIDAGGAELVRKSIGDSENVIVKRYEEVYTDVAAAEVSEEAYFMTDNALSYSMYNSMPSDAMFIQSDAAAEKAKRIKNATEIACAREAHVKDGAAVTRFIKWIKDEAASGREQSELSAADKLESLRSEMEGFIEPSFSTIAGYAGNGAIIHYSATANSNAKINAEGLLLVDSGGQYLDGTTDITRTIAMGPLTQEMIDDYTYVLKSHIAFARMRYEEGMSGAEIDRMVRKPMNDAGIDFNHGISHGVGHVLGVHEDAAVIRNTNEDDAGIIPGMIMSNEPGYYKEGEFGIRIENLVLFKEDGTGGVINEPLTCVPYERDAINRELLSDDEAEWINDYHRKVRETLSPLLDEETASWLRSVTEPV